MRHTVNKIKKNLSLFLLLAMVGVAGQSCAAPSFEDLLKAGFANMFNPKTFAVAKFISDAASAVPVTPTTSTLAVVCVNPPPQRTAAPVYSLTVEIIDAAGNVAGYPSDPQQGGISNLGMFCHQYSPTNRFFLNPPPVNTRYRVRIRNPAGASAKVRGTFNPVMYYLEPAQLNAVGQTASITYVVNLNEMY